MGDPDAATQLSKLAEHPKPQMRGAAAWAMGYTADPVFIQTLEQLYKNDQGSPKRNALRALVRIRRTSAPSAA
jgi:hypothetical protein